ncbi:MAG: hypothetical protein M1833_007097 [Piccolia ochrophora]|nr:MAG: hypothetical protein M1833_007097 [Piccolia ochrophora]
MVKLDLPSPPSSGIDEVQYGLHHVAHHNANTQYPEEMQDNNFKDRSNMVNPGQIFYNSPTNQLEEPVPKPARSQLLDSRGLNEQNDNQKNSAAVGLGIQHQTYPDPIALYPQLPQSDQGTPPMQASAYPQNSLQLGSPLTMTSGFSEDERRTRSGRRRPRAASAARDRSRVTKTPRSRKLPKQSKSERPNVPKLTAPLSELTQAYSHIPLRDMEQWVNRPVEVRQKEVDKRDGYVTRPMNSFMLYRSAYADRTKLWCLQNNHQIVSVVSGESWRLEPPEVRDRYNDYAKTEREHHNIAHPGYKFSPCKNPGSKKKPEQFSDDDSEPSDLDDLDFDWCDDRKRKNRRHGTKRQSKESGYPVNSASLGSGINRRTEASGGPFRSSYQANNPGKPLPAAMSAHDLYGQYYQMTVHPHLSVPNVEDIRIRKTETPGMYHSQYPTSVDFPGNGDFEYYQTWPQRNTPMPSEHQIDPYLQAVDGRGFLGTSSTGLLDDSAASFEGSPAAFGARSREETPFSVIGGEQLDISQSLDFQPLSSLNNSLSLLTGQNEWQGDFDGGSEFDKWYDHPHGT